VLAGATAYEPERGAPAAASRGRERFWMAASAALLVAVLALAAMLARRTHRAPPAPAAPGVRTRIALPPELQLDGLGPPILAISRDGSRDGRSLLFGSATVEPVLPPIPAECAVAGWAEDGRGIVYLMRSGGHEVKFMRTGPDSPPHLAVQGEQRGGGRGGVPRRTLRGFRVRRRRRLRRLRARTRVNGERVAVTRTGVSGSAAQTSFEIQTGWFAEVERLARAEVRP
jgi:hypothetical protein